MIGYYVHHVGRGHLNRALTLARSLEDDVTGLSSLERPPGWVGDWLVLPRDDDVAEPVDPTAGGRLHWAPRGHPGLRTRTALLSSWFERAAPRLVVVDVSVEVVLLARLHGLATIGVVLPGVRDDPAHHLGFDVADALVAFWPPQARGMLLGAPAGVPGRLHTVGAVSRFAPGRTAVAPRPDDGRRRVLVMLGRGGPGVSADDLARAREETPDWSWDVLDGHPGTWVEDPRALVASADVVVTHAGQNALAETAAAQRPAVVLPQRRPHDEQVTTGAALGAGEWPVIVRPEWPARGWPVLLDRAAGLDGSRWAPWCDGRAAARFAAVVDAIAAPAVR